MSGPLPPAAGYGPDPMIGFRSVLEFWNGAWWRWSIVDGKPVAFIRLREERKP